MPLTTRISLDAQRTIEGAFNDLKDAISTTDFAQLKDTTLDDVQQSMHKIEEYLSARGWVRNLRRLLPLITGLGHYSKTIEVLCNGTPFLPWIWAPIKLILKVSSEHLDAFEQIIKTYARIVEPLARFKSYNATYSKDRDVQQALSLFYADILRFHKIAYKLVRRGGWHILFTTSCGRFQRQFHAVFEDLKSHEDFIDKTANAVGLVDIRSLRENLLLEQEARREAAARKEEELIASHLAQLVTLLRVDDAHQLDVMENIIAEADDTAGSGGWTLRQPRIKSWASPTDDTKFLILHGHPGTGKSVLSARIARFLQLPGNSLVITHFCTYLYPESTQYEDILRCIILQLIRNSPELITHAHHELLARKNAPSYVVLEQLLSRLLSSASPSQSQKTYIHLVTDGLNECSENTQTRVFKLLQKLVASLSGPAVLKVLLVTRSDSAIAGLTKGKHQVSLSEEKDHLRQEIANYVSKRLECLRPKFEHLRLTHDDTITLLMQIVDKADGMILWAKLVVQSIASNLLLSRDEVFEAADTFPRELTLLYGQILSRTISKFNKKSSSRLSSILGWIALARRPLRQSELLSALSFSFNNEEVTCLIPSYILDACAPLVEMRADTTYRFIHVSVRDFLHMPESPIQLDESTVTHDHGKATIRCLLAVSEVLRPTYPEHELIHRVVHGVYAFLLYAVDYWLDYLLHELDASNQTGSLTTSDIMMLSSNLASALGYSPNNTTDNIPSLAPSPLARLLDGVHSHSPGLFSMARAVLESRRKTSLDLLDSQGTMPPPCHLSFITVSRRGLIIDSVNIDILEPKSLEQLKMKYQSKIRSLLRQRSYGSINITEFERFKHEARHAAFTCRLISCPNASIGLKDEHSLAHHESKHSINICTFAGCQYPPFTTPARLKQHIKKQHEPLVPSNLNRKSIRPGERGSPGHIINRMMNSNMRAHTQLQQQMNQQQQPQSINQQQHMAQQQQSSRRAQVQQLENNMYQKAFLNRPVGYGPGAMGVVGRASVQQAQTLVRQNKVQRQAQFQPW